MSNSIQLPFYLKISQIILGLVAFFFVLYIGQDIILPLIYATILAILLNPLVNLLCRYKINRVVCILISVLLGLIVVGALIYFITSQIARFTDTVPQLKMKFGQISKDIVDWIAHTFNTSNAKVNNWINDTKGSGSSVIGATISTIGGVLAMVFLIPVYIFMILFYKSLLLEFIGQLFPKDKHATVGEVLVETKALIQNYLIGLMFELIIVAALNSIGLLLLGIQYALLLGLIGALLNLIPYIGGLVATALPMIIAITTKSPEYAIYVFFVYILVQFIDNNFLVPKIVASKVKINALVSIIVVLLGGALWGIPGMFLSIPLTAIVKVMCDRIEPLKPWGYLLGDTIPAIVSFKFHMPRKRVKKSESASK